MVLGYSQRYSIKDSKNQIKIVSNHKLPMIGRKTKPISEMRLRVDRILPMRIWI